MNEISQIDGSELENADCKMRAILKRKEVRRLNVRYFNLVIQFIASAE